MHATTLQATVRRRIPACRRSWLFLPGADSAKLLSALTLSADVLIQELEDFTPAHERQNARQLSHAIFNKWREAGALAAVRINPLETEGLDDLLAVMGGRPDVVMMSKVA